MKSLYYSGNLFYKCQNVYKTIACELLKKSLMSIM